MEPVFHRRHKIKLVKDLKLTNSSFRQSLLDENEIENIQKIYTTMKSQFNIEEIKVDRTFTPHKEQISMKETVLQPSVEQKIEIYKKQKRNKKIQEKMKIFERKKSKRKMLIYRTPIKEMIEEFKDEKSSDLPSSYLNQLKVSTKQLRYVKSNSGRKRTITPFLETFYSRNKVISVQTGLPKSINSSYQSVDQRLSMSKPMPILQKTQNIEDFQKSLDKIISLNQIRYQSPERRLNTEILSPSRMDRKQSSEYERKPCDFGRSIKASQRMLTTLTRYFNTKKQKRLQYHQLINKWKLDRPITSELRRNTYTIVGQKNQKKIRQYRFMTQKKRNRLLQKNNIFYSDLLNFLIAESLLNQNLQFSKFLCEGIRQKLQMQHRLNYIDLQALRQAAYSLNLTEDRLSNELLNQAIQFINSNSQNQDI